MCFRPPQVQKPTRCPKCGTMNPPTKTACTKCQADLSLLHINLVNWVDIPVNDLVRAKAFYEAILGQPLSMNHLGDRKMAWLPLRLGAPGSSGALVQAEGQVPSITGSIIYLVVPDIDAALQAVHAHGGATIQAKTAMGDLGFIALFKDSEGNRVGFYSEK